MLFETVKDKIFGSTANTYAFKSTALGGTWASFAVFIPPQATLERPAPIVWFMTGIMVNYQAGFLKGGFFEHAAREGLAMVFPDSSPRGTGMAEECEDYRLGPGSAYNADCTKGE
jgi:S-formylglutathione hydrolase